MIPDVRREALSTLAENLKPAPDLRFGQLLAHPGFLGEVHLGQELSDMGDDEFLSVLDRHQAELDARWRGHSQPSDTAGDRVISARTG